MASWQHWNGGTDHDHLRPVYRLTRRGLAEALDEAGIGVGHRDRPSEFRRHGYNYPD